ncbi:GH32 C-terminal domain-containing protein [Marinimicrobium sp. C6131]|uniref:LamG-like jellyroll fold domain-containing protein n=1 Tax=Marinimicrobium sp. C6131 TaxID=3022676 RepID=UPI00223E1149|nr:LamG-like jellyroll fold domain-containing protein [Marinimicrobium sp. C6131]UZJ42819.1 GH32 C-terminal domain-containing protein [Marinimicrobium sp. C6131]
MTIKHVALLIFSLGLFSLQAHAYPSSVLHLKYDEPNGEEDVIDQVAGKVYSIRHVNNPPERVPGVTGNALRTDGYSTWLSGDLSVSVSDQMTLSTWIALESYPSTEEGNHQASSLIHATGADDFNLGIDTYGNWWFHVYIGGQARTVFAPEPFPLYAWTHVAATVNAGTVTLYINGVEQVSQSFPATDIQLPTNGELVVGRSSNPQISFGVFEVNAISAAYDETAIEDVAVSQAELKNRYEAHRFTPWQSAIVVPDTRFADDHLRPRYHALPPANWTNEPHGLVEHDGRFHMFYQRTPNGPYKWMMHWGHMFSDDLVNWTNTKDALYPKENTGGQSGLGSKGIWSGDVVMDNGWAHAFYTTVNYDGDFNPGVAWATSNDGNLERWTQYGGIIDKNDPNPGNVLDLRDPYVWHSDGRWHMIIGAATQNGGGLEYYHTTHLGDGYWERSSAGFTSIPYDTMDPGSAIWEMPVFEYLGTVNGVDKYVLVVSPIGGSMQKNNAPFIRSKYWTGTWQVDGQGVGQFVPDYDQPKNLDVLHGHLSPTIARRNGQLVAIGIVDERTNSQMQNDLGWAHTFSLPVEWRLLDDGETLGQRPYPGLESLRTHDARNLAGNLSISADTDLDFGSAQAELLIEVDPGNTGNQYGFYVAASPNMQEVTRIYYDGDDVIIDKSSMSQYTGLEESGVYVGSYDEAAFGKPESFRVYIDHSVIAVFINDKAAFHHRIYPSRTDSTQVGLIADGGTTTFTSVQAFPLQGSDNDGLMYDFEGDLNGWTPTGDAFSSLDVADDSCYWVECYPFERNGNFHVWGFKDGGDDQLGELQSPTFELGGDGTIGLLVGGGDNLNNLYVALIDGDSGLELDRVTGTDSEALSYRELDGSACVGQSCYLKAVDDATGGWGHLNLDAVQIPLARPAPAALPVDVRVFDFESGDLTGWTAYGDAFSVADVSDDACYWVECYSFDREGSYHLWGFKDGGDDLTGELHSDTFTLSGDGLIDVLISGGADINNQYLALMDAEFDIELDRVTGNDSETLVEKQLNGRDSVGRPVYLKAVDNSTGGWGHLNLDYIRAPVVPE